MKIPGPAHPITVERNPNRVVVRFGGRIVADTSHALTLREANYPPVHYIPRADAAMALFERTAHSTHCPFKGDASYFDLRVDGAHARNAVWSYEDPFDAVAEIAGHLAFYPDRVDGIEEIAG